ncbi:hypothetical protein [Paenibacillus terrae]|uniref:hypothetical protein n=1 Tax=Paenibacillus terrae TaxID=159743 RepID=UPI001BAFE082|nr:hypothetical protein [Paenibacillus terrae]
MRRIKNLKEAKTVIVTFNDDEYMRKYEELKQERFRKKEQDEVEDYYFLDQSAVKLSRSRINKIQWVS